MKNSLRLVIIAWAMLPWLAPLAAADDLFPDKGLEAAVRYEVFAKRYNQEPLTGPTQ